MLKWLPLLWSNVWRRKTRTALTMVSVLATFVIFGLLDSFRNSVAHYGNDYANALVVQSRNVRLPYSHVERLLAMPGITTASGVLLVPARLPSDKRTVVQGVDDRTLFEAHPGIVVSPQAVAAWRQERTAVLISAAVAKDNGWQVGDHLMLPGLPRGPAYRRSDGRNAVEIVIAGIFSAENTVAVQGIFAHYEYLRDLIGAERAGMEYIAVRLAPSQDIDVMRSRIDAEFANSAAPVKTYSGRALLRAYHGTYRELARLSVVVLAISSVTLLLIAGSVLMQAQRERARESAVLEAIGWSKEQIALFIAFESVALLLPPAVLGLLVAGAFASSSARTFIDAMVLAVALIFAVAAVPVMRSLSAQIAPRLARE